MCKYIVISGKSGWSLRIACPILTMLMSNFSPKSRYFFSSHKMSTSSCSDVVCFLKRSNFSSISFRALLFKEFSTAARKNETTLAKKAEMILLMISDSVGIFRTPFSFYFLEENNLIKYIVYGAAR